ncbi:DUF401 family protein [Desulfovibrio aminophilus]|nr:DUF401 family protein [Desulfovibrio aminophilus]MCM0755281.1 DUF401 family protein [Desulfovibrio aminophilus]
MDFAPGVLPLLKVLAAFAAMLVCIRLKVALGLSILGGAAILCPLFGMAPGDWIAGAARALIDPETLFLAGIVALILVLSDLLERTGQSRRLMDCLARMIRSHRLRLGLFPALVGFLPMPGGAIFSAPMVAGVAEHLDLDRRHKALINYWFRHLWEMAWPLFPGLILTSNLAGLPITTLIFFTAPGALCCLVLGWVFYLRPKVLPLPEAGPAPEAGRPEYGRALVLGLPLLVAIVGALGLEAAISALAPQLPFELGVVTALAAAVACVAVQNRADVRLMISALTKKSFLGMMLVIAGIFIFKGQLAASGAVRGMAELAGGPAALFVAAVFLPFLVGFIAGINVAFVGSTFPLLLGILPVIGLQHQLIPYLVLATFAGFTGVMASPIHICLVLTCQYFKTDLGGTWRRLVLPCALLLGFGCLYFLALTRLFA